MLPNCSTLTYNNCGPGVRVARHLVWPYFGSRVRVSMSPGAQLGRLASWFKWKFCEVGEAPLILQAFSHFTYVLAHSPTLPSLYLRRSSFSNPSVASPTSQLILQPVFRFSYLTEFSLMSAGEPRMLCSWGHRDSNSGPKEAQTRCLATRTPGPQLL